MNKREKIKRINTRISELKNMLSAQSSTIGDWKLIKQFEASMQGLNAPYTNEEMKAYHDSRIKVRDEINKLENELTKEI
jgi:hypothetical protein|nr:MAG TPA: hypothetical protein [Caudoviricetes sp.]